MDLASRLCDLVEPSVTAAGAELYDLELAGGVLRITLHRPGGVDLGLIATVTREVSRLLDEEDPIPGEYTLEVTSPGLERPLRTPEHFARAVGDVVAVKTRAGVGGDRRIQGVLVAADAQGITIRPGGSAGGGPDATADETSDRHLAYDDLERARTVFEWGPAPKPGGPKKAAGPATTRSSTKKSANQQKAAKR